MPVDPGAPAREALRALLIESAFLTAPPGETLTTRSGSRVGWMYSSAPVMLSQPGLNLMAEVLHERLRRFGTRQLATYGTSAVPLLGALLALGGAGWNGLVVRKEPKRYAARRQIEGVPDPSQAVVVVDESISSGESVYRAGRLLEQAGLSIAGAACLVEFVGYGAREWLAAQGYRLETVYDVWRDLGRTLTPRASFEPPEPAAWSGEVLPEGRSPAELVRLIARELRRTGLPPRPPTELDKTYDNTGGTTVSVRRRADDRRLIRAGYRRESGAPAPAPAADLVRTAVQALRSSAVAEVRDLEALKFSATFLGPPEPITLGQVDHTRYGLAVRAELGRSGFALPNSPHYDDDLQQYLYARTTSGGIWRSLPHTLARQPIVRVVEAGVEWPPDGVAAVEVPADHDRLAEAVGARVRAVLRGREPPAEPVGWPDHVHGVGVSLYAPAMVGCATSFNRPLAECLDVAARNALTDTRYAAVRDGIDPTRLIAVVSLLTHRRHLGRLPLHRVPLYFRLGRDTLLVSHGDRLGLVLAHFAVHQTLTPDRYVHQVLQKAGLDGEQGYWHSYDTTALLVEPARAQPLDHGFTARRRFDPAARADCVALAGEVAAHVLRRPRVDGLPAYDLDFWSGGVTDSGTATRALLTLHGLLRVAPYVGAGVGASAADLLGRFTEGPEPGPPSRRWSWDGGSLAALLQALTDHPDRAEHARTGRLLAARLQSLAHTDGAIYSGSVRMGTDLDLLSGLAVTALGRASAWLPEAVDIDRLRASLEFYRRRFELTHPWTMVWWHLQAWTAVADLVPGAQDFADLLADWALERQGPEGAFLVADVEPNRYSFLTACVLEGIGAVWESAAVRGDTDRARLCEQSWRRGIAFVERLVLRGSDTYADRWIRGLDGAVRPTLASSDLRLDFAGHTLLALGQGLAAAAAVREPPSARPASALLGRSS